MKQMAWKYGNRTRIDQTPKCLAAVAVLILGFAGVSGFDPALAVEQASDASNHSSVRPSVAADFLRELHPPGQADRFSRPRGMVFDDGANELLVSDSGNNRILIFGETGVLKFEFSVQPHCSTPSAIAVDKVGIITVAGSTPDGPRLFSFDYDGIFLRSFVPHQGKESDDPGEYSAATIAVDDRGQLYTLDQKVGRILCLDSRGKILRAFSVVEGMTPEASREVVFGSITIAHDRIYVPYSSLAIIGVFDLQGNRLGSVGHMGDEAGGLNFPVAVAVTDQDEVLVLDNNRFNVVCYDADGHFVQEFGGKGYRLGWFYHPTLLALDSLDQVYVGQIYQNWIQVCALPSILKTRRTPSTGGGSLPQSSQSMTPTTLVSHTLGSHPALSGSPRRTPVIFAISKESSQ